MRGVWLLIAALGAGGVAAATGLAALQAQRLVRPLRTMAGTSRRLGQGDFSARAGRFGIPEIDVVAEALDASAERIAEMVAREREFSGNVSHQLRTPLTALRLRLEEVAELEDPSERRAEAELALAEADRLDATIEALLRHARAGRGVRRRGPRRRRPRAPPRRALGAQLPVVAARAAPRPRPRRRGGRAARPRPPGRCSTCSSRTRCATGPARSGCGTRTQGRYACVAVEDEGTGVPAGAGDIFARGTTHRDGSGIGLHLARTLATAHAGQLVLTRRAPPRFELRLRLAGPS